MKTGLILVDIQNDYFSGGRMELVGMQEAGSRAGELLSIFRQKSWPTFHIQHISVQQGATFFLPETEGVVLHESIEPQSDQGSHGCDPLPDEAAEERAHRDGAERARL